MYHAFLYCSLRSHSCAHLVIIPIIFAFLAWWLIFSLLLPLKLSTTLIISHQLCRHVSSGQDVCDHLARRYVFAYINMANSSYDYIIAHVCDGLTQCIDVIYVFISLPACTSTCDDIQRKGSHCVNSCFRLRGRELALDKGTTTHVLCYASIKRAMKSTWDECWGR